MTEAPDASTGTAKDASSQRRMLACLLLGLFALSAYDAVFPVFATRIRAYFSINAEQYGTLMGMASIGRIPALLLVGPLIAGVGVRRIAKIALAGIGVSFLIIGIGGKLNALYAGIVVMGLFMALGGVAIPALLIALFPDLKRRIFSIHLVAGAVPGILIPLLAHQMLVWSADKGDRAFAAIFFVPFIIAGAILVVGGALLGMRKQDQVWVELDSPSVVIKRRGLPNLLHAMTVLRRAIHNLRSTVIEVLRDMLNLRSGVIVLLVALHGAADNTIYQFLPQFMEAHFQRLPLAPAWAVAGHGFAYLMTRSFLSFLPERVGQRTILILAGPIGGLVVIGTLWCEAPVLVPILYTVACLFFAAEYPVLVSEISSRSPGNFGSLFACGLIASEIVTLFLLKGTGRLADRTGDFRVALSFAACGFIAFGIIAALTRLGIHDHPVQTRKS